MFPRPPVRWTGYLLQRPCDHTSCLGRMDREPFTTCSQVRAAVVQKRVHACFQVTFPWESNDGFHAKVLTRLQRCRPSQHIAGTSNFHVFSIKRGAHDVKAIAQRIAPVGEPPSARSPDWTCDG